MRLAFDLDGVIVDFMEPVFAEHRERHGGNYRVEDLKAHDIASLVGWAEYQKFEAIFNKPGFFAGLKPYPGAIEDVEALIDAGHEIEIVSSPTTIKHPTTGKHAINGRVVAEKIDWVARYLPKLAKSVTITKNKYLVKTDALIDDAPHNITPWTTAHPAGLGIVIPQPWNADYELPKNAVRVPLAQVMGVLLLKTAGE